jgi:hypothetical protein
MIDFTVSDFVSFDAFPLAWRFATDRVGRLSPDLLARIRPLRTDRAAHIAAFAREKCEESREFRITFRSDDSPAAVRAQLSDLPPTPTDRIVVSWNTETAVVSDWELFVAQWDDFCYPSSDDVTIWPLDHSWTLCYRHYEDVPIQFVALSDRGHRYQNCPATWVTLLCYPRMM